MNNIDDRPNIPMDQRLDIEDHGYDAEAYDSDDIQQSPESVDDQDTPRTRQRKKKRKQSDKNNSDYEGSLSEEETPPISVAPLLPPPPLSPVSDPIVHDHLSSSMSSNSPEEGDIGITPGQEQAIQELQDMKNDMGYTIEEDPPDYDVTERVKQLNQELAKEPDPDDDRERSIKFKEKVVDFEVPPDDYSEDEGADGKKSSDDNKDELSNDITDNRESTDHNTNDSNGDITEDSADAVSADATQERQPRSDNEDDLDNNDNHNNTIDHDEQSHDDNEQQQDSNNIDDYNNDVGVNDNVDTSSPPIDSNNENDEKTVNSQDSTSTKKSTGDKILVERDGKFELLNSEDLTAEEKDLYLAKNDDNDETEKSTGRESSMGDSTFRSSDSSASTEISFQPHPPANQRPATAAGRKARQNSNKPRRAQSAQNERFLDNFSYVSPYAISDEDKKQGEKNKKHNEKLEKQKKEKEKQDQEKKQEESNDVFSAWLKQKKEQQKKRSNSQESKSSSSSQRTDSSEAFDAWLKKKNKDHKQKQKQEKQHQQEYQGGFYCRPRKECDTAFRQWLRKKNKDSKQQQLLDKHRTKIGQLLGRKTHTALAIARAMKQSQSFQYVDYYGYRY